MTDAPMTDDATATGEATDGRSRCGRPARDAPPADGVARRSARAELESLAGHGMLDDEALLDLAEVRWRTGDLAGAGEAANVLIEQGRSRPPRARHRGRVRVRARAPERGPTTRHARPRGGPRAARAAVRGHPAEPHLAGRRPRRG